MSKLIILSLLRVNELAQDAFTAHEGCMRRGTERTDIEVTELSVECKTALENHHKWVNAIIESLEDEKI